MSKEISFLDIHEYSEKALRYLYSSLKSLYNVDKENQKLLMFFVISLIDEDKSLKKIIEEMDKIDGIRAKKSKLKIEKIAETWLKKAYFQHLYHNYSIIRGYFTKFTKEIIRPKSKLGTDKLKRTSVYYFERYNDKYKKKLKRCRSNERVLELQKKYPKLNVVDAFAFGLIIEKFATTNEDLEWFENIVRILIKKKE
ncbi:MAG: hypothetical protein FAF04_00515 [Epsilonproteobacteria bacterium]|nr:hypothetical protein [Campylobacterota bacterium]